MPSISAPNDSMKCEWVPPDNKPPEAPTIDGPANVKPGVELCWTFQSIDPDGDDVMYIIDWGDGTFDETNYFQHETPVEVCHTYEEKDAYLIRARAIDVYGYKGEWSTYYIPKNEDDCELCPKVNKQNVVNFKRLIDRLEILNNRLSVISKHNPEIADIYRELSDRISTLAGLNLVLKPVTSFWSFPILCIFLFPLWCLLLYLVEVGGTIIFLIGSPIFFILNYLVNTFDCYWLNPK